MEVLVLDFLLIRRLVMGVGLREEGVVKEAFLQVRDHLSLDSWGPEWVLVFVLLWFFGPRTCSVS